MFWRLEVTNDFKKIRRVVLFSSKTLTVVNVIVLLTTTHRESIGRLRLSKTLTKNGLTPMREAQWEQKK